MTVLKRLGIFFPVIIMLTFSACKQDVYENISSGIISDQTAPGAIPDSSTSEVISDPGKSEAIPDSSTSEVISDPGKSEAIPDSSTSEVISDPGKSEAIPDSSTSEVTSDPDSSKEISEMTTFDVISDMGLGINLGNTMEACGDWIDPNGGVKGYETAWGSPEITEAVIRGYADSGFGALRIPVAWSNLMGENYTINAELTARVKRLTEWTVNSGMYAIVNIHWDNGWWEKFPYDKENCMKKYTRIWEQIAAEFNEFDEKVIFESLNEEGGWDSLWNRYSGAGDKESSYSLLNGINQKFVDIIRASRGNNETRHLLIAGYAADIDLTCDPMFRMPNDPQNRCAVSVHYYTPATFCILKEDADWGRLQTTWGSADDLELLVRNMDKMKTAFTDNGIPVIIGEFGVCEKQVKDTQSVRRFLAAVVKEASERRMCPVLWDISGDYYDRISCKFIDGELLNEMRSAMPR